MVLEDPGVYFQLNVLAVLLSHSRSWGRESIAFLLPSGELKAGSLLDLFGHHFSSEMAERELCCLITAWQVWQSRFFTAFARDHGNWDHSSRFCGVSLGEQLLSRSFPSCSAALPLVLWADFSWVFCLCPLTVLYCGPPGPFLEHSQKGTPGNSLLCHSFGPEGP